MRLGWRTTTGLICSTFSTGGGRRMLTGHSTQTPSRTTLLSAARCGLVATAVVALLHVGATRSCGANVGFLPGDTFFHARLTEDFVVELDESSEQMTFSYSRPAYAQPALCGYTGFWRLEVVDTDRNIKKSFRRLYKTLRRDYPKIIKVIIIEDIEDDELRQELGAEGGEIRQELNGIHVFVYNADYDVNKFGLGLKYNEQWHSPPKEAVGERRTDFFPLASASVYEPFVREYNAVVQDWRRADKVDALSVRVPKNIAWAKIARRREEPVRASASNLRFVVIPDGLLTECYRKTERAQFWEITAGGVMMGTWKDGKLYMSDWAPNEDMSDIE